MKYKIIFCLIIILLYSCNKDENTPEFKKNNLEGYAQKGPFISGTDVTIIELDKNLVPTGKSYYSTIDDNSGHFIFPEVTFNSNFIELKVTGKYFDENLGGIPLDGITLYSIVDFNDGTSLNINLLTHIEESRIKYLLAENVSFQQAQAQSHEELLKVFNLAGGLENNAADFDITSSTIDGGILLFISSVLLKNWGTGVLFQEFLSNFITDFREDGVIDSEKTQIALATGAYVLDIDRITANLTKKYSDMGRSIKPYEINLLKEQFLENTSFTNVILNVFPSEFNDTINLMTLPDTTIIDKDFNYCISIISPNDFKIQGGSVFITSDYFDKFSTTGIDWYIDGNILRYGIDEEIQNNNKLIIPFTFWDSGQVFIETRITLFPHDWQGYLRNKLIIWK